MANISDFLGRRQIAEFRINGERISPLGEPDPPVNPGEWIEFVDAGTNRIKCDLSNCPDPKVHNDWHGVVLTRSGNKFTGTIPASGDHSHPVALQRFKLPLPRGRSLTGIECEVDPENHATHMGVWHAPD